MKLYYYTACIVHALAVCTKYFADNLDRHNGVWLRLRLLLRVL